MKFKMYIYLFILNSQPKGNELFRGKSRKQNQIIFGFFSYLALITSLVLFFNFSSDSCKNEY